MRLAAALLVVAACRGGGGGPRDEAVVTDRALPPVTDELVVVRADAWLYTAPSTDGARVQIAAKREEAGDARIFRLVERRPDGWVEVENATEPDATREDCYQVLSMPEAYRLRFFVQDGDVLPVTTRPLHLELPDDAEVALAPGAIVVDGRVELPRATVTMPVPADAVGRSYRAGALPEGRPDPPMTPMEEAASRHRPWESVGTVEVGIHEPGSGVTIQVHRAMNGPFARGGVRVAQGCVRLRLPGGKADRHRDDGDLAREEVMRRLRGNGLLDPDAGPGAIHVPAGAVVRREDGRVLGRVVEPVAMASRCISIAIERNKMTVCHDVKP